MARAIYTVHARLWSAADDGDAVFVKEGFSWPAFFLGPIWALWHGMWRTAITVLALSVLASGFTVVAGMTSAAEAAVTLGLQTVFGLWANDWRRYVLRRADYAERAVVSGRNLGDAERDYFAQSAARGA